MPTEHTERIVLELEPVGGSWSDVPVDVRVRRLLRAAVRSYGLRVKVIRRVEPKVRKGRRKAAA